MFYAKHTYMTATSESTQQNKKVANHHNFDFEIFCKDRIIIYDEFFHLLKISKSDTHTHTYITTGTEGNAKLAKAIQYINTVLIYHHACVVYAYGPTHSITLYVFILYASRHRHHWHVPQQQKGNHKMDEFTRTFFPFFKLHIAALGRGS